jgi:hypothetical protein
VVMAGVLLGACGSSHHSASPPSSVSSPTTSAASPSTTTRSHPKATTTLPDAGTTTTTATTTPPTTEAPPTTPSTTEGVEGLGTSTTAPSSATTSTTVAPTTTAAPVDVIANCTSATYEPATIILACGDGGVSATQISWSAWGATSATGTSIIKANLCNPDCAQGSTGSFPATITLSGVTSGASGQIFSTLTASFSGASPNGNPTESYSLSGIG